MVKNLKLMSASVNLISNYTPFKRILLHFLFWSAIIFMQYVSYQRLDFNSSWILFVKDILALLAMFYFTGMVIIPKWLMKGKFLIGFLWILIFYLVWAELTLVASMATLEFLQPGPRLEKYSNLMIDAGWLGPFKIYIINLYLLDFVFLVSLPLGMKVMQAFVIVQNSKLSLELDNTKLNLYTSELQRNNLQLELDFLKSQINPHFLFNTLNNITLLVSENDRRGESSLTQLSGIMYYLLHQSNRALVTLEEEFSFLNSYIELEKLGLAERVVVDVQFSTDDDNCLVAPLIAFPLIENAFKHGPKANRNNNWIKVDISVTDNVMKIYVANQSSERIKTENYVGGVGTENVRKRLELNYAERYKLDVDDTENQYTVSLVIDLKPKEIKVV